MSYSNLKEIIALLEEARDIFDVEAGVGMIVGDSGLCEFTAPMEKAEIDINTANYFLHRILDEEMDNFSVVANTARYNCVLLDEISKELKISPFRFKCVMRPLNGVITNLKNLILEIKKGV